MGDPVNYYVVLDGQTMGPYSVRALEMMAGQGKIDGYSQVFPEGGSEWLSWGRVAAASAPVFSAPSGTCKQCGAPYTYMPAVAKKMMPCPGCKASIFPRTGVIKKRSIGALILRIIGLLMIINWGISLVADLCGPDMREAFFSVPFIAIGAFLFYLGERYK